MDEVMRFVHPRLGVVEIDRLGRAPELTAGLGSWTMSDDAERELRDLWVRVAERLSKAGATVAELDVCGTSPELIQGCPGWERFPRVDGGPWGGPACDGCRPFGAVLDARERRILGRSPVT